MGHHHSLTGHVTATPADAYTATPALDGLAVALGPSWRILGVLGTPTTGWTVVAAGVDDPRCLVVEYTDSAWDSHPHLSPTERRHLHLSILKAVQPNPNWVGLLDRLAHTMAHYGSLMSLPVGQTVYLLTRLAAHHPGLHDALDHNPHRDPDGHRLLGDAAATYVHHNQNQTRVAAAVADFTSHLDRLRGPLTGTQADAFDDEVAHLVHGFRTDLLLGAAAKATTDTQWAIALDAATTKWTHGYTRPVVRTSHKRWLTYARTTRGNRVTRVPAA